MDILYDAPAAVAKQLLQPGSRPTCKGCKRSWQWPRNLAHVNLEVVPAHIPPTTKSTVVAHLTAVPDSHPARPTIPENAFRELQFSTAPHNRLVEEILYHADTGKVHYDIKTSDPDHKLRFARIITMNTWYKQLFNCFISVGLSILDYYCNFVLLLSLIYPSADGENELQKAMGDFRYPFVVAWTLMLLIQVTWSAVAAKAEWGIATSHRVGDLLENCSTWDLVQDFAALVFFIFFSVEHSVRDVIIRLHPWKSVQPFAAFKADGTRAYIIGYRSAELFRVEERRGQFFRMFTQQVLNSIIFSLKVFLSVNTGNAFLVITCITSFPSIVIGWFVWFRLMGDRRRLRMSLDRILQNERENKADFTELQKREYEAAKNLYKLHFGAPPKRNKTKRSSTNSSDSSSKTPRDSVNHKLCQACGRDAQAWLDEVEPWAKVGDSVCLTNDYMCYSDAEYGPMEQDTVGQILEVGPDITGIGARCKVTVLQPEYKDLRPCQCGCGYLATRQEGIQEGHCCNVCAKTKGKEHGPRCEGVHASKKKGTEWWYDLRAVELADPEAVDRIGSFSRANSTNTSEPGVDPGSPRMEGPKTAWEITADIANHAMVEVRALNPVVRTNSEGG